MIVAAWSIWSWVGAVPSGVDACRMICVPPCRSSASSGVQELFWKTYTPSALMPARTAMMIRSPSSARHACRTGVEAATDSLSRCTPLCRAGSVLGLVLALVVGLQALGRLLRRLDVRSRSLDGIGGARRDIGGVLGLVLLRGEVLVLAEGVGRRHDAQDRLAVHLDL